MSAPLVSGEQMIAGAQVGSMIYSRFKTGTRGEWQTGLLVRESKEFVQNLGPAPVIQLHAGAIEHSRVLLVALIAKIAGELYETWFNYYQTNGAAHFQDFQRQAEIALIFFTPERARIIAVRNGLADFFQDAERRARERAPWAMHDFDVARELTYAEYPEVQNLWAHLAAKK